MKASRTHTFHGHTFIPCVHPFLDAAGLTPVWRWKEQTGQPYPPRFRTLADARRWANAEATKAARAYIIELRRIEQKKVRS